MPRSPTSTTRCKPKRLRILSTCAATVLGSPVEPSKARYSVPSHWSDRVRGVADIVLEWRQERITVHKQPCGTRAVQNRHYLDELAKKSPAMRQVAPELMEELNRSRSCGCAPRVAGTFQFDQSLTRRLRQLPHPLRIDRRPCSSQYAFSRLLALPPCMHVPAPVSREVSHRSSSQERCPTIQFLMRSDSADAHD